MTEPKDTSLSICWMNDRMIEKTANHEKLSFIAPYYIELLY